MQRKARQSGRMPVVLGGALLVVALVLAGCQEAQSPAPTPWSSPLPRSMKGYELYSWYAPDEGEWNYVLLTGTNRLKGYDEIVSPANEVTPEGWVALSVVGTEGLQTLLSQLPSGEEVFWIGQPWLTAAGADPPVVEKLGLPEAPIVAEIEHFCQESGIHLHVDAAPD